ncbi:MAG: TIM barrel protein [Bacteroidota bacterium]
MNRRKFIQNSLAVSAATTTGSLSAIAANRTADTKGPKGSFRLKFAPHIGMFKHHAGEDPVAQLEFMAAQGFMAFEDNGMKGREKDVQGKMAAVMEKHGMTMGVFVAHKIHWTEPNLASGKKDYREAFLDDIRSSVEVAKRVNAKWMTVVPGHIDLRLDWGYQIANVTESLKQAAAILEPHDMVMVLEPLNFRDHPGLFLSKAAEAYQICKSVDSPACKILYDIYHQQITEGNLIPNIKDSWDEIAYFQIGDNPGRKEPTTGEINYANVFKYIHEKGFEGVLGMEHGNSQPGKDGEKKVIEAYQKVHNW